MATLYWIGAAAAVAQVNSYAFGGTWLVGETITVQYGNTSWTYTTTSTSIATIVAGLVTAYNALSTSIYPQFTEQTAAGSASPMTLTADTAGKPFTVTITTNSASGTITPSITTANAGPRDVSSPANYSSGTLPVGACSPPVQSNIVAAAGGSLTNGTPYYWVITATNANGETTVSNEKTYTPSGGNDTATLAWAQVTNATGYKIYRSTTSGSYGATSLVNTIGSGSTLTYNDTGAALSSGTPPGSNTAIGDTLYIDMEGARLYYGLNQSTITLTARRIVAQDVIIGLPRTNTDSTSYPEYRPDYWQLTATSDFVSTSSGRIKLDHGSGQTTFELDASGSGLDSNTPAVLVKGTNSSNVWNFFGGQAGLAFYEVETSYAATLRIDSGATVTCGLGCTLLIVANYGGNLAINSNIGTSLNHYGINGGITTVYGTATVAQLTMEGGTVNYNSTGALGGNTVLAGNSLLTVDGESRPKTITNPIQIYSNNAQFQDSYGVVSGGYTLQFKFCTGTLTAAPNSQFVVSSL